ncbi:hypothetical protein [Streptomyces sp. NPDC088762]|uniref:hypothetical protein n=1 Tax=Streptomyces sp. NPDC088762 TaxID=3365891 RepID=UPI003802C2B1
MKTQHEEAAADSDPANECGCDPGPMVTLSVQVPEWVLKTAAETAALSMAEAKEVLSGSAEEKRETVRGHLYVDAQVMMDMRTDAEKAFVQLRSTLPEGDICTDCATDAKLVEAEENMLGALGCAMTACFVSELADYSEAFTDMLVAQIEEPYAVSTAAA